MQIRQDLEDNLEKVAHGYEAFKKEAHKNGMMRGLWKGINAFQNFNK